MYVLGLSGGRTMGNSEILVREALMGAEDLGAEVELIRLKELEINPPAPVAMDGRLPDHSKFISKKLEEADGIVIGAPSYALTPPGYTINVRDRMSGRHGPPPKLQVGALIGVGGSDWVQLLMPMLYLFLPHGQCKIVDQLLLTHTPQLGQVVLNEEAIAKARKIGRNVVEALQTPAGEVKYLGEADEYLTCPICHQNLLRIRGRVAECPICDIQGSLEMQGGEVKVNFSEEAFKTYHWGPEGLERHLKIIADATKIYKDRQAEAKERIKKYEAHVPATVPPPVELPPEEPPHE